MICFPNAKINIGLNIAEKRPDGYHNIEAIFYPIGLCDVLEITEGMASLQKKHGKCTFQSTGLLIPGIADSNLCVKAYTVLNNDIDLPSVHIHLHKIIPIGGGLGGGSSDGAFTIKLLNAMFGLKLSEEKMENYARKLGSDCAFFIKNSPVFAYEKGDKFKPAGIDLDEYYIVVVYPGIHINTSEAYSEVRGQRSEVNSRQPSLKGTPLGSAKELIKLPVSEWQGRLHNDFEDVIFPKQPEIKTIKEKLYSLGAEYASMSGSGSSVYGIFERRDTVHRVLKAEFADCLLWTADCRLLFRSIPQQINPDNSKDDIGNPHC